jgi:PAT family beta-lactamase induction signal transducer AmpG
MKILKQNKFQTIKVFFELRMFKIFLLGIISGFPWVLIGSSLSLWLKEEGLSRSTIGWAGAIFAVYAINYLWAPLVDKLKIFWLTKKIGHRKSWIFLMQLFIGISLLIWSSIDPQKNLFLIILIGLLIAIFSSTQDISIDALRIEQIKSYESNIMAAAASMAVIGWWTGFKIGGLLSLFISDYFEKVGFYNYWQITFIFLFFILMLLNFLLLTIEEVSKKLSNKNKFDFLKNSKVSIFGNRINSILFWTFETIVTPIYDFFKKNGLSIGIGLLAFLFLFKIGEAFLGRMSLIFYKEIGFTKSDIGIFSKGLGWITTVLFTLIGGFLTVKIGLVRSIFIAGIFMAVTNLLFSLLFWTGKNYLIFSIAVILDDLAAAFATVAFVAFISVLVNRQYTATQYALLASIGTLGRTTLASSSGSLVDYLNGDWGLFFVITSVMVIPSLILIFFLKEKIKALD